MSAKYFQVFIDAENKDEADKILNALLAKKFVSGGLTTHGPSKFFWKGEIVEAEYYNISAFTIEKHKEQIISEVKSISVEEAPMIWFVPLDGNREFIEWIDESIK